MKNNNKGADMKKFIFILSIFALCLFAAADGAVLKSGKKLTAASNYSSGDFYKNGAAVFNDGGGYIAEFDSNFDVESFANSLGAKKVAEFKNGSYTEFYYYSNEIPKYVVVGGERVNLHFVKEGYRTVAGAPFIYSGY